METRLTRLNVAQEQTLADSALLNCIFVNTPKGSTSAKLKREINVPEAIYIWTEPRGSFPTTYLVGNLSENPAGQTA